MYWCLRLFVCCDCTSLVFMQLVCKKRLLVLFPISWFVVDFVLCVFFLTLCMYLLVACLVFDDVIVVLCHSSCFVVVVLFVVFVCV